MRWLRPALVLVCMLAATPGLSASSQPLIAAASNLQFALEEILAEFEARHGDSVRVVYGASGNLTRQISQGADFELFLSADERYVERLQQAGHTQDGGALYAIGQLVLYAADDSPLNPAQGLSGLMRAVNNGRLQHVAMANPEHAPYGRAARQALQAAGVWQELRSHVVLGENASQAARFASSGAAQAGLIPLSLARLPRLQEAGRHTRIDDSLYTPLRQRMVLMPEAGEVARQLYADMQTPSVQRILSRYGFESPN